MFASQETKVLSINELDERTRAELVRDVACSVFFGFYDNRSGYIDIEFRQGDSIQGIYGFIESIERLSDDIKEYEEDYFCNYDDVDVNKILKDSDLYFWKYNPYLSLDFTNLLNDFHYYLKDLGKRYNIILNSKFYKSIVPDILDEINTLCIRFIPDIDNIKQFNSRYITTIKLIYDVELLPTIPEIYRKNERGEIILYAKQTYEYNTYGDIAKITTNITDYFGGDVIVRYRDTLI